MVASPCMPPHGGLVVGAEEGWMYGGLLSSSHSWEGGGVLVILSHPRGCYYLFNHPLSILLSHLSSYIIFHLKLLFERCLKYIHANT